MVAVGHSRTTPSEVPAAAHDRQGGATPTSGSDTPQPTGGVPGGVLRDTAPSSDPLRTRPAAEPSAPPTSAAVAVVVSVAFACVQPGAQQTVVVRSRPGLQVTVNLRYADGHMGDAYGGLAVAQTIGPDGTYRETWTLPPAAPAGPATVYAGVASTSGPRAAGTGTGTFTIADRC